MVQGDLSAYRDSTALVEERARELLRQESEGAAQRTQDRLDNLNSKWEALLSKAKQRRAELEDALREVGVFLKALLGLSDFSNPSPRSLKLPDRPGLEVGVLFVRDVTSRAVLHACMVVLSSSLVVTPPPFRLAPR